MTAPALNDIGDALAAAVRRATEVNEYAEPVELPQNPAVECVFIQRVPIDMCGGQQMTWAVEISVSADAPDWSETGRKMRVYLEQEGPQSIEARLTEDRTLGGVVDTLTIVRVEGANLVPFGDGRRWLSRIVIDVWT